MQASVLLLHKLRSHVDGRASDMTMKALRIHRSNWGYTCSLSQVGSVANGAHLNFSSSTLKEWEFSTQYFSPSTQKERQFHQGSPGNPNMMQQSDGKSYFMGSAPLRAVCMAVLSWCALPTMHDMTSILQWGARIRC